MWLAIEGVIGAGKTTTAEAVAARSHLTPVIERSEQHPLLQAYYRHPHRFAVETELVFMALQAHQVRQLNGDSWVSDYAPAKNFVFARSICEPSDLLLLEEVDRRLWRDLPAPHLTLFLDVPPEVCLQRIRGRGRAYELGLEIGDLERIQFDYLQALDELGDTVRIVEFDGGEPPDQVAAAVLQAAGVERLA
jgi:deoxyadenosine/deoxycytidine kinase